MNAKKARALTEWGIRNRQKRNLAQIPRQILRQILRLIRGAARNGRTSMPIRLYNGDDSYIVPRLEERGFRVTKCNRGDVWHTHRVHWDKEVAARRGHL